MIRKQELTKEELADLGKSEKKFWILLPLVLLIFPLAVTWIFNWPWVVFWSEAALIFVLVFSYYQSKGNQAIRKNRDKGIKWIRRGKIIDVERTMSGPDNTKVKYRHHAGKRTCP